MLNFYVRDYTPDSKTFENLISTRGAAKRATMGTSTVKANVTLSVLVSRVAHNARKGWQPSEFIGKYIDERRIYDGGN